MATVLGLDPGFALLGYALVDLLSDSERVLAMGVIRTEKSGKKRAVKAADDNVRRAQEIASALHTVLGPVQRQPRVFCAEAMSFPRSASVAAKMAMAWGVVTATAWGRGIPIIQASPQEVKGCLCGKKDASKDEVRWALDGRYDCHALLVDVKPALWEHAYDALAAAVACFDSPVIQMARQMRGIA